MDKQLPLEKIMPGLRFEVRKYIPLVFIAYSTQWWSLKIWPKILKVNHSVRIENVKNNLGKCNL